MKNDYPHIFSPLTVKNMTIKNRIVMMPMGTNYGEQNGEMSFLHINYYEQRAKGGTGLIIVENASIDSPQGSNGTTQLRIDHDNYLPRLFKFCENIHRYGTKIAIQINHAGASAVSSRINMQPVSASDIPSKEGGEIPRPLSKDEILHIVKKYGADTLRLYEMFMGPLEQSKPWSMAGCDGARRWIDRVYRLFIESGKITDTNDGKLDKVYNQTVKKVTEDYESLGFNTAISQMMIFVNEAYKADTVYKPYAEGIVKMLSCITPHIGEEMWQLLGHESTIAYEPWPTYDEAKLVEDTITCVVQVNGKVRGKFEAAVGSSNEVLQKHAMELETVQRQLEGKTIRKVIVVKGKVVNIVAN